MTRDQAENKHSTCPRGFNNGKKNKQKPNKQKNNNTKKPKTNWKQEGKTATGKKETILQTNKQKIARRE